MMSSRCTKRTGKSARGTAEDAKSRRERGNLAQRAFRQKQIDTIRTLKEENERFRHAISAISRAATQDKTALIRAIKDARALAGIEEDHHEIVDLPRSPAPLEDQGSVQQVEVIARPVIHDDDHDYQNVTSLAVDFSSQANCCITNYLTASPHPDRHLRLTAAPVDIIPYTGAAAYTVAGQIHWVAIAYSYAAVKALRSGTALPSTSPATAHAAKMFGDVMDQILVDELLRVVHGRLIYRKHGFMAGAEHPARDPWLGKRTMEALIDRAAPTPRWFYLSAFDVTERLQQELGLDYWDFEATLAGRRAGDGHKVAIMRELMKELGSRAFCYGDGPRWHPDDVKAVAQRWILETIMLTPVSHV